MNVPDGVTLMSPTLTAKIWSNRHIRTDFRMLYLAMWRADDSGVARFAPGELEVLLGRTTRTIHRNIRRAIDMGLLHPESNRAELIVHPRVGFGRVTL